MSNEHDFTSHSDIDAADAAATSASQAPQPDAAPRYNSFSQAIGAARRDAASSARETAPKLKEALSGAAHDITYGAAFGACFAAAFAKELLPTGLKEALRRGARDGRAAANSVQTAPPALPGGHEVAA